MSGDQEPHTNGLNGDASDEEVSSDLSESRNLVNRKISHWKLIFCQVVCCKCWRCRRLTRGEASIMSRSNELTTFAPHFVIWRPQHLSWAKPSQRNRIWKKYFEYFSAIFFMIFPLKLFVFVCMWTDSDNQIHSLLMWHHLFIIISSTWSNNILCFQDEKNMRPVDIEADVKEMERRKRVEAIMQSQVRIKYSFHEITFD